MTLLRDGSPASPGIVIGPAYVLRWETPRAPRASISADDVEAEVERFHEARRAAMARIQEIQRRAEERLGTVEAQIFEPQLLMLEDAELVDGVVAYIRQNRLTAARAIELRMLEVQSDWRRTGHPMVLDRLNDLLDVETRLLRVLLGAEEVDLSFGAVDGPVILVARDLTPSLTVQLDRSAILGIATDAGTRTSHSAILARAAGIPAVVGLGDLSEKVETGAELILDGHAGRVIADPDDETRRRYRERDVKVREWEQELLLLADLEPETKDGQPVQLRANIDLPAEAEVAQRHGARGVGLFRTEFLVVGRSSVPGEEEQYRAYRQVAEAFRNHATYIRTYDLGGDKFPLFLKMPVEENPYLGWRAIRVCLDMPELFRPQLRALLRATAHGDVRIMLPLINEVDEIRRTRAMLEEEEARLRAEGIDFNPGYKVGIMIETPAAALTATELAQYADFFSIGTNDLVQYTLAVDRGNARLASRYNPFHPAVVRMLRATAEAGRSAGIEVSVCGELAANPLGVFLLLGLGITSFSVGPASLPEVKKIVRSIPAGAAREAVDHALGAETATGVAEALVEGISQWLDLSIFSGRWGLGTLH